MNKLLDSQENTFPNTDNNKRLTSRSRDHINKEESELAKYQKLSEENDSLRKIISQKEYELEECHKRIDTLEKWMKSKVSELSQKIEDLNKNEGEEIAPLLEQFKEGLIERDEDIQERLSMLEEEISLSRKKVIEEKDKKLGKITENEEVKKTEENSQNKRKRKPPGEKPKKSRAKPRPKKPIAKEFDSDEDLPRLSRHSSSEEEIEKKPKEKSPEREKPMVKKTPSVEEKNKKNKEKLSEEEMTDTSKRKASDEEAPKKKPVRRTNETVDVLEECTEEDWNKAAWNRILKK